MSEAHAQLSPSAADRWMTCPGSVVLSEGMPERSSAFAEEGTRAHALAEAILTGADEPEVTDEMHDAVTVYTESVLHLASHPGAKLHVEVQVRATEETWGTADAIVWRPDQAVLYVRDLKYGAGVPVEVEGNKQLKIYALAALLTMGHPAKKVNVGIVQPRCPHADGPIRCTEYDVVDLLDFHADLLDATTRVDRAQRDHAHDQKVQGYLMQYWIDKHLVPSEKGCRWCLAAPTCPKLKQKAQQLAKQVFAPTVAYEPLDLANTLDFLPILEGWIKNTREFAYAEAEQGHAIPSYKLVEKRATRKWKPDLSVADLASLCDVPTTELYKPQELLAVGEIEKLAPGKNAKERAAALEAFTTKESSGHTLVHESDKREAIRVDAKAAFENA